MAGKESTAPKCWRRRKIDQRGADEILDYLEGWIVYSYEDRLRAVQLYIRLGKRVDLTIRQFGYPTKNALKHWHQEYEQRLDCPLATCADRDIRRRRRNCPSNTA